MTKRNARRIIRKVARPRIEHYLAGSTLYEGEGPLVGEMRQALRHGLGRDFTASEWSAAYDELCRIIHEYLN